MDNDKRRKVCEDALRVIGDRKKFVCALISNERVHAILALERLQKDPGDSVIEGEVMIALLGLEGYLKKLNKKKLVEIIRNILEDLFLKPSLS